MMPKARFSQKLVLKKVFLSMYELMLVRRVETQNVSKGKPRIFRRLHPPDKEGGWSNSD